MNVDRLHESAMRLTGLSDFGDTDYLAGLHVLAKSYVDEAALTPLGEKVQRAFLRSALVARLFTEAAAVEDAPITRPVFVTGLPRTGTTALHRLLCADPAHQGLEVWLTDVPQPRPPVSTWASNPVYVALEQAYAQRSDLAGAHRIAADQVEECWYLLRQSMMSISFECLAHIPSYSDWLAAQDWTPAYRRHRRNLQLIGSNDPGRRWILKNPSHMFALDALLAVYPDALIVQTHRDPVTAIASVCSLNAQASRGWSTVFEGALLGRSQLDLWARGYHRFAADRAKHDPAHFLDVHYDDFIRDPVHVLEQVYDRLGSTPPASVLELAQRGTPGSHRYDLADFGLTASEVAARFDG
ncbi:sulfotransferase family protein [Allorhizocola rhizosphaerae]|uniref:sulfotransferase family protein n=1 Tax=Allorhizocola rhizosphaerae TaxID=1872709 RepID=UPI000E3DEE81|nr:sulfotransferase [Allorhizocola rhizosphaerae]